MEDTKQRILEKSLELFSTKGYDAVSVGEIAKAVGIKAPSLYNHFPSKQAIFDAILETTSAHYQKDTAEISVHVQDSQKDIPVFSHISEELLVEKVRQIFLYSLHDKTISQFRRMMTLEQFRSPKFAELLSKRYVDWMISYHAGIFRALVANGELRNEDPDTLAWMYVSPIIVLLKTELFYLEKFDSIDQLEKAIIDYIDYYNNRRIKLKLNGLSPVQYRIQTVGAA